MADRCDPFRRFVTLVTAARAQSDQTWAAIEVEAHQMLQECEAGLAPGQPPPSDDDAPVIVSEGPTGTNGITAVGAILLAVCCLLPSVTWGQQREAQQPPPAVTQHAWRVCHVVVPETGGAQSHGSGVIVDGNWLMSAHHVFRQPNGSAPLNTLCYVDTPRHGRRVARLKGWSTQADFAVAAFDPPLGAIEPLAIAEPPAPGEPCWGGGHAGASPVAHWIPGVASQTQYQPDWCAISTGVTPARQGQSGGPCFDQFGRLCGIVSKSDGVSETFYSDLRLAAQRGALPDAIPATETVLAVAVNRRALLPWNRSAVRAGAIAQGGTCQPSPGIRQPTGPPIVQRPDVPAPIPDQPTPVAPSVDSAEIARLIYERMSAEPDRWRGPAGPPGPAGSAGAPPSMQAILSQLPPITIAVENYDGSTATATKRLGESFTIKFFRPPTQSQAQTDAASIR